MVGRTDVSIHFTMPTLSASLNYENMCAAFTLYFFWRNVCIVPFRKK